MATRRRATRSRPALAGATYFCVVFVIAFGLGVARVLAMVPLVGALAAVLIEVPILLCVSWIVAGRLIFTWIVAGDVRAAAQMGLVAFTVLMGVELGLALVLFDVSLSETVASLATLPGAIGLGGQIAFAFIPALHVLAYSDPEAS
jgi:hypothetical protein